MYIIFRFIGFYCSAITRYQIHAPQLFDLVSAVLEDNRQYYAFSLLASLRKRMLKSKATISRIDFGAGRSSSKPFKKSLRDLVRTSASSPRQGKRLFRLVAHLKPRRILEMGTSVGLGTLYLALPDTTAKIITLEGCPETAGIARENFSTFGLTNLTLLEGPFEQTLPAAFQALGSIDLLYVDGNHQREATLHYFKLWLDQTSPTGVCVFDDIYWSAGMTEAWKLICAHPSVTRSVDFFDFGIVWTDPAFKVKQHFKVVPYEWKWWKALHVFHSAIPSGR